MKEWCRQQHIPQAPSLCAVENKASGTMVPPSTQVPAHLLLHCMIVVPLEVTCLVALRMQK